MENKNKLIAQHRPRTGGPVTSTGTANDKSAPAGDKECLIEISRHIDPLNILNVSIGETISNIYTANHEVVEVQFY
ncbi:hypothetical protein EVAR_10559_1 [Eumeta japonica]|uniref:Uncharacterized protein n=1 Tax=Eumeta variegata TaxID=151549 RepID=A0A4C1ZK12_EUMVA|nr:hypothetical protein EVAR_10559_1 [Eumeta japonica]